jgi:hypothetical protein
MHQQYIADIEASSREALASVNPGPIFKHYGENVWAAVRAHLDAVTEHAAASVIAKYTGVLGGSPRPRPQRPGPSLTTTHQDDHALMRDPDRDHALGLGGRSRRPGSGRRRLSRRRSGRAFIASPTWSCRLVRHSLRRVVTP